MYVMSEQYHFLKCEEQFFSSNIINSPYRGLTIHVIASSESYCMNVKLALSMLWRHIVGVDVTVCCLPQH